MKDRNNFACARSSVTSLVPLERKETQPFFGTSLKKSVKVCGYTSSAKFFGLLGKIVRSFGEDRVKRPMGMKARLTRSLGGFARREQRNQVWDDASVSLVEGF